MGKDDEYACRHDRRAVRRQPDTARPRHGQETHDDCREAGAAPDEISDHRRDRLLLQVEQSADRVAHGRGAEVSGEGVLQGLTETRGARHVPHGEHDERRRGCRAGDQDSRPSTLPVQCLDPGRGGQQSREGEAIGRLGRGSQRESRENRRDCRPWVS